MKKDERLQLRLTKEEKQKIKVIAALKNMDISEYIMWLVKNDLQLHENLTTVLDTYNKNN